MLDRLSENNYATFEEGILLVILIILVTRRCLRTAIRARRSESRREVCKLNLKSACTRHSNEKITLNLYNKPLFPSKLPSGKLNGKTNMVRSVFSILICIYRAICLLLDTFGVIEDLTAHKLFTKIEVETKAIELET